MEEEFNRLMAQWQHDTCVISSCTQMREYDSYKKLVAMGEPIIPLLLKELATKERHGHINLILRDIVGDKGPIIPKEQWGRMQYIWKAWLDWGKENGYYV